MLARIFMVALIAGAVAGVSVSVLQLIWSVPLIVEAEKYEAAGPPQVHSHAGHTDDMAAHQHQAHGDGDKAWEPASPVERGIWTLITNTILAVGGALVVAAAFALRRTEATLKAGLAWGGAGFLAFAAAPALGLPPELPGTATADLAARQVWWVGTAAATGIGIALLVYGKGGLAKAAGALALVIPHVIGAPEPEVHAGLAPAALQHEFLIAALLTSAVFWISIGGLVGVLSRRFHLSRAVVAEA